MNEDLFDIGAIPAADAARYVMPPPDTDSAQGPLNLEASQSASATLLNTDLSENAAANPFARLLDEDDETYNERV